MKLPLDWLAWLRTEQIAKWPAKFGGRIPAMPEIGPLPIPDGVRKAMPVFVRTTTFKLAMLYSAMIAAFSGALLAYLYYSTVYYIRVESERRITVEFEQLANAYYTGGMERLSQSVFERMTLSGSPFYYYLEDTSGRKIAGHFPRLPDEPPVSTSNFRRRMAQRRCALRPGGSCA
jgi:hypothetical protein